MTYASKGRLMLGSFCEKDEQKECVVIEADLHLLSFTFSGIHDHMLVCKIYWWTALHAMCWCLCVYLVAHCRKLNMVM